MADLTTNTGIFSGDTSVVDSTEKHPLGTRAFDTDGNEYIYLLGVADTELGTWVNFDEDHVTTRLLTNAVGRVGVAMAATIACTYGWYQIYGHVATALAITDGDCAANVQLYTTSTAGSVDDVDTDPILGAISRVAETTTAGYIEAEINFPFVMNAAID